MLCCCWDRVFTNLFFSVCAFLEQRCDIINSLADLLEQWSAEIVAENRKDLSAAKSLAPSLLARLELSTDKLSSLAKGLRQIASASHKVGTQSFALQLTAFSCRVCPVS